MSIQNKLFIAFLLTTATLIGAMVVLFQWQLDRELFQYLNKRHEAIMKEMAEDIANQHGDNLEIFRSRQEWRSFLMNAVPKDQRGPDIRPQPILLLDTNDKIITLDVKRFEQEILNSPRQIKVPIRKNNDIIGYLVSPKRDRLESSIDQGFRDSQRRAIRLLGLLAAVLSAGIAFVVARHLTAPIRQLSQAAYQLTQQQFTIDVDTERRDELGKLARDIQELALRLQQHSDARQRWFADISHELRTPLSVLRGEIEALLDGIRPLTHEHILSLHQEVGHLLRLVADLHDLAQADLGTLNYQKDHFDFADLLDDVVSGFEPSFQKAKLQLDFHNSENPVSLYGDSDRLRQLCNNLLQNSLRYTDSNGIVHISLEQSGADIRLTISDSTPGVPDASLPLLFDHLYRVDSARTRNTGGSGLGLAICKRIAEAHQGSLTAEHSVLGGLSVVLKLPVDSLSKSSPA
jgi:two-component system sensor histidine kinase BaeS